ncbi:hypothetical protein GDO78_015882 [Eleutherodactylus coqui]|uniref:Taste receptor type 2 n=1 Tax=Eleutherodactylus coqui TaxID=57060 RepID=A0A8J6JNL2_ELECQ|nr:hypothetical protein GDO78_015882 [Eleutherodactylus coqui]
MADSTEGDTDIRYLALLALIAGLLIHSFIIWVNVTDWWKGRSMTHIDQIVTCLGISRMCSDCANILLSFIDPIFQGNLDSHVALVIGIGYNFSISANIWLSSLLSIVFWLKISNFHTRLFLYLRGMIVHRTVYLIGASVLISAVNSLIFLLTITEDSNSRTYNKSMTNPIAYCKYIDYVYPVTIGAIFPLLSHSISSVLLFTSLYHHITKMKMSSNLSINLETYYSVMKFVAFTFIYNTVFLLCYFYCIFYYYVHCVHLSWLIIVMGFLPVLHSSNLIYRTAKLRSQMSKVLQNVIDFLFDSKDTETSENIKVVAL